jgi:ABC-type glycerol-3-phosphate transport system substrate-binding protein
VKHLSRRDAVLRLVPAAVTPLLAACAGGGGGGEGAPAQSQQPVQLNYLHQWSPTQGHGPITDTLVARWNQENPTTIITGTFTENYYVKLAAILAAGDFPDIITYNLSQVPLLINKKIVVPAETLSKGTTRLNLGDLVPAAREMATFDGKLAVTPYVLNSSGLCMNTAIYRQRGLDPNKPPTTWDEYLDQARRITGTDSAGKEIWGSSFPKGTADPISPLVAWIWQNGGDLVDVKNKKVLWTSQAAVEALQWQVDLVTKHRVAPYPNPGNGEMGNVGIWHIPPGNVSALELRIKGAFPWTTAELPKGKQQATTVGGHSLAVLKTNKSAAVQDRAWRFVHWYTTPAINAEYLVATTTLPPWKASEQHAVWQKYTKDEPRVQPFTKMLSYARPTPKLTRWEEIIAILGTARDAAAEQKRTAKEALEDAARQADPLIQEG